MVNLLSFDVLVVSGGYFFCSAALCAREEFLKIMKLNSTDLLTVKLWLDKKVCHTINCFSRCNMNYISEICSFCSLSRHFGGSEFQNLADHELHLKYRKHIQFSSLLFLSKLTG